MMFWLDSRAAWDAYPGLVIREIREEFHRSVCPLLGEPTHSTQSWQTVVHVKRVRENGIQKRREGDSWTGNLSPHLYFTLRYTAVLAQFSGSSGWLQDKQQPPANTLTAMAGVRRSDRYKCLHPQWIWPGSSPHQCMCPGKGTQTSSKEHHIDV